MALSEKKRGHYYGWPPLVFGTVLAITVAVVRVVGGNGCVAVVLVRGVGVVLVVVGVVLVVVQVALEIANLALASAVVKHQLPTVVVSEASPAGFERNFAN